MARLSHTYAGLLLGFLLLCWARPSWAVVQVSEKAGPEGKPVIVMENAVEAVTIDPTNGGRVSDFLWKPTGKPWILPKQLQGESGLFLDHVWQQTWPGELLHRPYEAKILERGPERASVEVSVIINGNGDKAISGVRVVRTMTITGDRPGMEVTIRLENPTTEPRSPGYWIQNIAQLNGSHDDMWTFRPTTRGTVRASFDYKLGIEVPAGTDNSFVYDPTAGWNAATQPSSGGGVVFLLDYNYLRCLYNCGGSTTMEWWYDQVRLAPGKAFETKVTLWPFTGMTAVSYAGRTLVGDLQMHLQGQDLALTNRMVAGPDGPAGPATVKLELLDYDTGAVLKGKEFPNVTVTATPVEQQLPVPGAPLAKNLLARTTVTAADGKSLVYENYRPYVAVMGTEKLYKTARPPRVRPIDRPAVITRTPHEGFRLLHLRGPFHNYYQLPEAVATLGNGELKYGSYGTFVYGPSISYFPSDYPELMAYDVIVLNNVPLEAMDEQTQQYLADYVENGGVLLVIGGYYSFGSGGYKGSEFEKLLPATTAGPFDMVKVKRGFITPPPAKDSKVGAAWAEKLIVRPEAQVLMKAGDVPFWIQWQRGKGRVIILAGTCYGEAPKGMTLFTEWSGWPAWLAAQLKQAVAETRQ